MIHSGIFIQLFPTDLGALFNMKIRVHDWVVSSKQELSMRPIKLKANQEVYQLRPDFVMP